jgi:hypothetical protein
MLLRNKATKEEYNVPSGVGKAMIHAGLAEEVVPAAPKQTPRTSWNASEGRHAGIDYQFPPFVSCYCSTCNQKQWVENATAAFAFRHCGVVEKIPNSVLEDYRRLLAAYKARSKKQQKEPALTLDPAVVDRQRNAALGIKTRQELIVEDQARWELAKRKR